MAKIKISTIRQLANAEVININASFVAKVVRARHILEDTAVRNDVPLEELDNHDCMMTVSPQQLAVIYKLIDELYVAMLDEEDDKENC